METRSNAALTSDIKEKFKSIMISIQMKILSQHLDATPLSCPQLHTSVCQKKSGDSILNESE